MAPDNDAAVRDYGFGVLQLSGEAAALIEIETGPDRVSTVNVAVSPARSSGPRRWPGHEQVRAAVNEMSNRNATSSVRLSSDMVLTARTLAGIAARFTTAELGELVDRLISHLDTRERDADMEPDPELCPA